MTEKERLDIWLKRPSARFNLKKKQVRRALLPSRSATRSLGGVSALRTRSSTYVRAGTMFLLSCGRASIETPPTTELRTAPRVSYETFTQKHATAKELRRAKVKNTDIWSQSASDEYDDEPLSYAAAAANSNTRGNSSMMNSYDGVAAQVRPLTATEPTTAFKSYEPALWTLARPMNAPHKQQQQVPLLRATVSASSDEIAIPELHVGVYQTFCQPQFWSPAFASPGDFTLKMASVTHTAGDTSFQIAVICSCIQAVRDGARVKDSSKRKSFVKYVRRTQRELARFTETMALRTLGHRLADRMPTTARAFGLSTPDQSALDEYGEAVILFLGYVLSITEIGFNLLVALREPVAKHILVREFLDLSSLAFGGVGDTALPSANSCDARLERPDVRPLLPSAWLDVEHGGAVDLSHSKSCYARFSPRGCGASDDVTSRSFGRFSDSTFDPAATALFRSQSDALRPSAAAAATTDKSKCTQYVPPMRFFAEKYTDGAFTVEISGVTITGDHATYTITVLSFVRGTLVTASVERRFAEFDALARTIDAKVESLRVRKHLPAKTLFRYLSASYLERRAASLQTFLEKLLRIHFVGMLDQDIAVIAEPNVRTFLDLPSVEWSLVPWSNKAEAAAAAAAAEVARTRRTAEWRRQLTYPSSPTVGDRTVDSTTHLFTSFDVEATPRYQSLIKRRGDSM